jgi:Raf kinase inhibitor-like YbhB/YbcL family protein
MPRSLVLLVLASVGVALAAAPATAQSKFKLTSPAFTAGAAIPDGFTCGGANATPPLRWTKPPKGTKELAVTLVDPDAPTAKPFVHWVAWGIPPSPRQLPEQTLPPTVQQGNNGAGSTGYLGPCPPPDAGAHRYRFTLYALDEPTDLAVGASLDDLLTAIKGTVLAKSTLVGRYDR